MFATDILAALFLSQIFLQDTFFEAPGRGRGLTGLDKVEEALRKAAYPRASGKGPP